jgi:3-oxoadipate enol-lactonase
MVATTTCYTVAPHTTLSVFSATPTSVSATKSSPALIFLHFWGGSARTFSKLSPLLSSTHSVFAIDFRGWGYSTGPHSPGAYSISNLADDVRSLVTLLPGIADAGFVLVGHSMGGKVAQLLASCRPPGLKGVLLVAPAPAGPLILPSEEMKEQQMKAYNTLEAAEFTVRNVLSAGGLEDEEVKTLVEDTQRGNEWARKAWPAYGMGEDYSDNFRDIDVPVRIVVGALDIVEPAERVRTEVLDKINIDYARDAKASMVVVEGSGHMLPLEKPERLAEEIRVFCNSL